MQFSAVHVFAAIYLRRTLFTCIIEFKLPVRQNTALDPTGPHHVLLDITESNLT